MPTRPNPYHVLVSEAMLQQTQVATVVDYFNRFIEVFEDIPALAAVEEQQVLRLWQGLGYYRRARNLHAAAGIIQNRFAGQIPADPRQLQTLPGVGPYTAGAIASIAFYQPYPALDGNVGRVLARWFAIEHPIDEPATQKLLWALAKKLLPRCGKQCSGRFNQALMELGDQVCKPVRPHCSLCPVAGYLPGPCRRSC